MKKVKVYIEKGADDYSAYMDDTPLDYSCIGQGATVEEAIEDFRACYNYVFRTIPVQCSGDTRSLFGC